MTYEGITIDPSASQCADDKSWVAIGERPPPPVEYERCTRCQFVAVEVTPLRPRMCGRCGHMPDRKEK